MRVALFKFRLLGAKFIREYWDGIRLAIKFVEADAIIIKIKAKIVISKLSNLPIISVGFVKILPMLSGFWFKNTSTPATINTEKIDYIIENFRKKWHQLTWSSSNE